MDDYAVYNITVHAGSDYQIDLSIIADDETELTDYGALIFDEILRDGSGSTINGDTYELSDDWIISDDMLIYQGSGQIIVGNWLLSAQLREYPEATDYFDFDVSVDTDGYKLSLSHEQTEKIPFSQGCYDVFVTDVSTGIRSKLISGKAYITRRVTR